MAVLLSTSLAVIVRLDIISNSGILSRTVGSVRRALFISDCFDQCYITVLVIKAVLVTVSTTIFKLSELRLEIAV